MRNENIEAKDIKDIVLARNGHCIFYYAHDESQALPFFHKIF